MNNNNQRAHPARDPAGGAKQPRPRGTGSVYPRGGIFWIKYSRAGRSYCESSRAAARTFGVKWIPTKAFAEKLLGRRLGEITSGTFLPPAVERITVGELVEDTFRDYRINARKSLPDAEARWELHLQPVFGHVRAADLCRSDGITRYIDKRRSEGAANATINRELSLLRRAFYLGRKANSRKVREVPSFDKLKEASPRQGFLEDGAYHKLVDGTPLWFRTAVEVARKFAWRWSEVVKLKVEQVDLFNRTIRLHAGETKNSEGREVPIPDSLYVLLVECVTGKRPEDQVFTRPNGKPVKDFRWTWRKACVRAGVGRIFCPHCERTLDSKYCSNCKVRATYQGLLFHDLRRTGARNLRRSGVAEGVIMEIGGWKTRSVFERYNIVSQLDKADAMRKLEAQEKELQRLDQLRYSYTDRKAAQKAVHVANRASIN